MTNYEVIKEMSVEEMAAVFYLILKPVFDFFGLSEEQRNEQKENIMKFLSAEVEK